MDARVGAGVRAGDATAVVSTGAVALRFCFSLYAERGASLVGAGAATGARGVGALTAAATTWRGLSAVADLVLALAVLAVLGCETKSTSVSMSARLEGGLGKGMVWSEARVHKRKGRTKHGAALNGAIRWACGKHAADRGNDA